jgi:DNA-binding NtrC family response regulator
MADGPFTKPLAALGLPATLDVAAAELVVAEGTDAGRRAALAGRPVTIGTHPQSSLALGDDTVSRIHAQVVRDGARWVIEDLGSTNGTFVGGARVLRAILRPGDRVACGHTAIDVRAAAAPVRLALHAGDRLGDLVGRSVAMRLAFAEIAQAAVSDLPVLLQGETGTGKELAARALHATSGRASGPFVVFDCAATPESLVEAELFGREKGAYTGADATLPGALERASGGTLFFDEIGELRRELQPRLLRALEAREVRRLGGSREVPVDVRIVAATNRDLRAAAGRAEFRDDLYFRIAAVTITMPPLRERRDDVALLAAHFLARTPAGAGRSVDELMALVRAHLGWLATRDWPGNVRELKHAVERAAHSGLGAAAPPADAAAAFREVGERAHRAVAGLAPLRATRETADREYLEHVLAVTNGDLDQAAAIAGVHRKSLERLLRRHRVPFG